MELKNFSNFISTFISFITLTCYIPIFSKISSSPEFFIAHNLNLLEIILLIVQIPILLIMYFFIIDNLAIFNDNFFFLSNLSVPDRLINLSFIFGVDFYLNILPLFLLTLYMIDGFRNNRLFSLPMLFSAILIFLIYEFPSSLLLFWLCFYFFKVFFEFLRK